MSSDELRRTIEAIKLRAPIEEVVRERIPTLKKTGALWAACCPFHEEKTPSFKVDPRRGTWHCFGACSTGGDQISFLEKLDNLSFFEALEILAARTGVELPKRRGDAARPTADEALYALMEEAVRFYRGQLASAEGQIAVRYLAERGLSRETGEAFRAGYSPESGQSLLNHLKSKGADLEAAHRLGLVRTNDAGRSYDFFRGRLMIPIFDHLGRPVGFGARRLSDGETAGPKYINSPETPLFHKGRLIYALDRALPTVRKCGHILLVEGYTDVMAAHQVGLQQVVAVLGTATTEEHAGLVRKSGARRISLVFDGDEAGQKAAWKALHGLLALELEIDVVTLTGGIDPCDLFVREGAAPMVAALEVATPWFDFVCAGLKGLRGAELSRAVDRVLELLVRVPKPVHRAALLTDLSAAIQIPVEDLRAQGNALLRPRGSGRMAPRPQAGAGPGGGAGDSQKGLEKPSGASQTADPQSRQAWQHIVGALLADPALLPAYRQRGLHCPHEDLERILAALFKIEQDVESTLDCSSLLAELGDDPVRLSVVPLFEAGRAAESPLALLVGQIDYLNKKRMEAERRALEQRLLQEDLDADSIRALQQQIQDIHKQLARASS
jgi:DNA primase